MRQRKELLAVGATALVGLLVGATTALGGLGGAWDAAMPVALGACLVAALAGLLNAARARAAIRAAERLDAITGLPNGAQLRDDINAFLALPPGSERRLLLLFDLVGFKPYNDAFGFASGDALLHRLAGRLVAAVAGDGAVYRLRGGQFALLTATRETARLRAAAGDALFETGEGFMMRCAQGAVSLPAGARDASEALKLADQEIQAERATLRNRGIDDVSIVARPLAAARGARAPFDVLDLAVSVGQCLGMVGDEIEHLELAAALRDVGMMAVPHAVVLAPGRLGDEDWRFIALHTIVGERLLRSNFGMNGVAALVRSSHERWDGGGYPDATAAEDIPLGSRVLFVCGAFQDMTTQRAHRPALTAQQALGELERCSGTQFDPAVVAAFVGVFGERMDSVGAAALHA